MLSVSTAIIMRFILGAGLALITQHTHSIQLGVLSFHHCTENVKH